MTGPTVTGAGPDARTAPAVELGRSYLAAHPPPGRVLLCAVTGSHIYGFPSPDSDIDLKGLHLAPTRRLLGLGRPAEAPNRAEVDAWLVATRLADLERADRAQP